MIQRCFASFTRAFSLVWAGSVETQYWVGSDSARSHSISSHSSGWGFSGTVRSACPAACARLSRYAARRFCCAPGAERCDPTKQFAKCFIYNTVVLTRLRLRPTRCIISGSQLGVAIEAFRETRRSAREGHLRFPSLASLSSLTCYRPFLRALAFYLSSSPGQFWARCAALRRSVIIQLWLRSTMENCKQFSPMI
jgi:hypothetical protein